MAKKGDDMKSARGKAKKEKALKVSKSVKTDTKKPKPTPTVKKAKTSVKPAPAKKAKPKPTIIKVKTTEKPAAAMKAKPKLVVKKEAAKGKPVQKPKKTAKPKSAPKSKKAVSKKNPVLVITEKRNTTPFMDANLKKWKKILIQKKQEIFNRLVTIKDESYSDKSKNADIDDIGDASSGTIEQSFNLGLIDKNNIIISQIDAALERIEKKTFGVCVQCDANIPLPRLNALPYTPYCLVCADKPHND